MDIETILVKVKNGTCPFTNEPYNCARCEVKPELQRCPRTMHFCLCITRPLHFGAQGWRDTLKCFDKQDRPAAKEILTKLLQLGVESIPIGCDFDHFCFKHGCVGHPQESEASDDD